MQTISDELVLSGIKKDNIEGMKYLFIDEMQNVNGFEDVLNGFRSEGGWAILNMWQ